MKFILAIGALIFIMDRSADDNGAGSGESVDDMGAGPHAVIVPDWWTCW